MAGLWETSLECLTTLSECSAEDYYHIMDNCHAFHLGMIAVGLHGAIMMADQISESQIEIIYGMMKLFGQLKFTEFQTMLIVNRVVVQAALKDYMRYDD